MSAHEGEGPRLVRKAASTRRRLRLTKYLIPLFLVLYVVMIPLNSVVEQEHSEVFPFFKWRLFSNIPDWQTNEYALVLEAVDGQPVEEGHYLIPNTEVRDWKALRLAALDCVRNVDCDDTVADVIFPLVIRSTGHSEVEFSIIRAEIDLREVQPQVDDIANGKTAITDFFQSESAIGRWNTEVGRISAPVQTE